MPWPARCSPVFRPRLPEPAQCVLLTGRIRPVDREYLLRDWYPRIRAGTSRGDSEPLYVVATQTIEVGADIDLDGLVTESAALPALIQRLGRVNRRGDRDRAVTVAVHADALEDKVYGTARQQTWQWLAALTDPLRHRTGRTAADLGPASARRRPPCAPGCRASRPPTWRRCRARARIRGAVCRHAGHLGAHLTRPASDIPVAPYLHGIAAGEPTVSIVWRADARGDDPQQWRASAERLPPSADEAIEIPVSAARRWLASPPAAGPRDRHDAPGQAAAADTLSDDESQAAAEDPSPGTGGGPGRRALRYGGPGEGRAGHGTPDPGR